RHGRAAPPPAQMRRGSTKRLPPCVSRASSSLHPDPFRAPLADVPPPQDPSLPDGRSVHTVRGNHMTQNMETDPFNVSMRKFLKQVGVTSQQAIEKAVEQK